MTLTARAMTALRPYGKGELEISLLWALGLTGLILQGRIRARGWLVLALCQGAILPLAIWGNETWYPIFIAPLTAVGIIFLPSAGLSFVRARGWGMAPQAVVSGLLVALLVVPAASLARRNLSHLAQLRQSTLRVGDPVERDYEAWTQSISEMIPRTGRQERVFLDVFPAPYLGLVTRRPDLSFRQFIPVDIDPQVDRQFVTQSDYMVLGRQAETVAIGRFVQKYGTVVGEVGRKNGSGYYAVIYRIAHPEQTATSATH